MKYTREDVSRSYHQGHVGDPMANVKVNAWPLLEKGFAQFTKDEHHEPKFSVEWIEANVSESELDGLFWLQCEWRWEDLQMMAEEIFGKHVKVWATGRSGGYATVQGLDDVDEWDAVSLAKWRKFEKYARAVADYIPADIVSSVYHNEFLVAQEEAHAAYVEAEPEIEEAARAANA